VREKAGVNELDTIDFRSFHWVNPTPMVVMYLLLRKLRWFNDDAAVEFR
jgi:hypothetical protein